MKEYRDLRITCDVFQQVLDEPEFMMLEGMANHQARAVKFFAGGLIYYAPIVSRHNSHSAIAYLVRRLDENTIK